MTEKRRTRPLNSDSGLGHLSFESCEVASIASSSELVESGICAIDVGLVMFGVVQLDDARRQMRIESRTVVREIGK